MVRKFEDYIHQHNICNKEQKILLAISGGIDSVVMLHLFIQAGYNCTIAHCNFKLRGKEADHDESFVVSLAAKYKLELHNISFDTKEYAKLNGISIEMAARTLRYNWFEQIRIKTNCEFIATAHHQNDVVETFLMNIARGTGIRGLSGIKEKNDRQIIRPMLFAMRKDIEEYCNLNKLEFCSDSTNSQTRYVRNKFRHLIIPFFEEINPSFNQTIIRNIQRFRDIETIYLQDIEAKKSQCIEQKNADFYIHIPQLELLSPLKTYLLEFLRPFDFSNDLVDDILENLHHTSGRQFFSSTHRLIKDRNYLIVTELTKLNDECEYQIDENIQSIFHPINLEISKLENNHEFNIPINNQLACLDADKVIFPLTLRKWQKGDFFFPLGMKNKKKLSDFFNDNKFSLLDKENCWLLCSQNEIVWIVGYRIDNRFRISNETKNILQINWLKNSNVKD